MANKIRAIAIREVKLARLSQLNHEKVTAALSSLSHKPDVGDLQKQSDLLHIEAVLVSEGINDNDDAFMREELKRAISTPLLKPMNWQHQDQKILGAMYAVEARDLDGNPIDEIGESPVELVVQGVVWHRLPHIQVTANEIVKRIEEGNLFVSMECWFDDYEYALYRADGELFDRIQRKPETAFLDSYLKANGGAGEYNGMRIGRALSGVSFGGCAFVDRPANKRSYILNHFVFDPSTNSDDDNVTETTLFSNKEPMEVIMNDLNHAAASKDEIVKGVNEALEARERAEAVKRTEDDLKSAVARVAELESKLSKAEESLDELRKAIQDAYAGATSDTPEEIAKIDRALDVKEGAGDATLKAKIAWIADSRRTIAKACADAQGVEADTKLLEENKQLKEELNAIKAGLREREIKYLFAEVLKMSEEEVDRFVKAGLAKASDEEYDEWLEEKKVFVRQILAVRNNDSEAGLLAPTDMETPIDDHGATLRPRHGRVPSDVARTPRSKLTAAAGNLEDLFDEPNEPDLSAASGSDDTPRSPMGQLVESLMKKDKEV